MKLLFKITIPAEPFNTRARDGGVAQTMGAVIQETRPESISFTGNGSGRGADAVYDAEDGSPIPALAEPWFLTLNAHIEDSVAITPEELMRSGLDDLFRRWG